MFFIDTHNTDMYGLLTIFGNGQNGQNTNYPCYGNLPKKHRKTSQMAKKWLKILSNDFFGISIQKYIQDHVMGKVLPQQNL